ncbi:MAG: DUF3784 domain-containing protein [Clostridia bacterium]
MEMILSVFFSLCFLAVYVYAILLLCGKGGEALGGYHISSKDATARKEHRSILRKAGICLLLIAAAAHAMCLFFIFGKNIWGGIMVAVLIAFSILSVCVLNTKKMINKENKVKATLQNSDEESNEKKNEEKNKESNEKKNEL